MAEMTEPGLFAQLLGRAAYEFTLVQPLIPTYIHLLVSALFPIYAGAHASLSRPSSAAKPEKKRTTTRVQDDDSSSDEDEEEEEEEQKMEGLAPSDALIMPLFAGVTLAGLYFLIKWLKDPTLLNKILNGYFAIFGVFSVSRLITDALDMGHSLIFPRRYALDGALYHVHGKEKKATPVVPSAHSRSIITSPLPGFLSKIPLPTGFQKTLWADREMPTKKWTVRMYMHRIFAGNLRIGPHGVAGFILALAAVAYFNFVDKPWYLTNLMGFGFSYGALQLMSPTTFGTGSLILGALFFYDIYFVFYTPMMVTVAKSLDVPIKLVFPRPAHPSTPSAISHAMLGLGDVVLPGIMIGLALRFDLYLFYLRKQTTTTPTPLSTDGASEHTAPVSAVIVKPKYFSLAGRWSDHFWTHSLFGHPLFAVSSAAVSSEATKLLDQPFTFPKTYFRASLVGYVLGMLTTLGAMQIWGHAQPALLYLVPGVVGSLWLTALVRGEWREMWEFSEAVEDDGEAPVLGDGKGTATERSSFFNMSEKKAQAFEDRVNKAISKHVQTEDLSASAVSEVSAQGTDGVGEENKEASEGGEKDKEDRSTVRKLAAHRSDREVFSFSIEAPWRLKNSRSVKKGEKKSGVGEPVPHTGKNGTVLLEGMPNWKPIVPEEDKRVKDGEEPAGKRIRVK